MKYKPLVSILLLSLLTSCEITFVTNDKSSFASSDSEKNSDVIGDTEAVVSNNETTLSEYASEPLIESTGTADSEDVIVSTDKISESSSESDDIKTSEDEQISDPYVNVSSADFYKSYTKATSYWDSYYRTQHNFMSGSIEDQLQRPTIADNQPMEDGKYVFNSKSGLSADGLSYNIVDKNGNVVNTIFKGGAYVILEEVAAYLYAFGDIPPNYTSNKSTSPSSSAWGKYLRVNHSYFSCDTSQYKYEPELPDLTYKQYYEIDIGTTGSFEYSTVKNVGVYNNGSKIIRGASRIVYTRNYTNGGLITDPSDRHVFYTFNHYNDFQEYLNYENGWGEWFGNIAGGGTMNNSTTIYKTSYPSVVKKDFY